MSQAVIDDAPLMLSVSGARGIVGRSMTPAAAARFAGHWTARLREVSGEAAPLLCLGRDGRPSGASLAAAATAGILAAGGRVLDLGVVATPTVGFTVVRRGAAGGLVVTASHNPKEWNGLKALDGRGAAPPAEVAAVLVERFRAGDPEWAGVDDLGSVPEAVPGATVDHVAAVLGLVDADAIRAAGLTVVLDSVNGAGAEGGRRLLEALGCTVIHLHGEPTGRFGRMPEPIREHLGGLCEAVREHRAACGFAQDPDADRLALVDERGEYPGEECTLALCVRERLGAPGVDPGSSLLAANLSTSRMIDDVAAAAGAPPVRRTPVGEANVVAALVDAEARGAGVPLVGGEGNGGVILPAVCWVRDSLSSMAMVLSLLVREGRPLSALVGELGGYAMVKEKLDVAGVGGREAIPGILDRTAAAFAGDVDEAWVLDRQDGVRVDRTGDDAAWVHVRPSNTEPILRIIAEAGTAARARALVERVRGIVNAG